MRKPSTTSRSKPRAGTRTRKVSRENEKRNKSTPAAPDSPVSTARAATEDELAAIARSQQGHQSAESFWKAAGRFTKLR